MEATFDLHAGCLEHCIATVDAGLAATKKSGVRVWDSILLGHASASALSRGDFKLADTLLARMEADVRESPVADEAYFRGMMFWHHFLAKDMSAATHQLDRADRLTRRRGVPYFIASAELGRAIASHHAKDFAKAELALESARSIAADQDNPYLSWVALMFGAWMRLDREDCDEGMRLLSQAMALGARHRYAHFHYWPKERIAVLCDRALAAGLEPDYAKHLIHLHRLAPPPRAGRYANGPGQSGSTPWDDFRSPSMAHLSNSRARSNADR